MNSIRLFALSAVAAFALACSSSTAGDIKNAAGNEACAQSCEEARTTCEQKCTEELEANRDDCKTACTTAKDKCNEECKAKS